MQIVFAILAFVLKLLLGIVLFLLFVLLAVLLVPVRYRAEIKKEPDGSAKGGFRLSWLLRLLQLKGSFGGENGLQASLKLCGFSLKRIGSEPKEPMETMEPEEARDASLEEEPTEEAAGSGRGFFRTLLQKRKQEEEADESEEAEEPFSEPRDREAGALNRLLEGLTDLLWSLPGLVLDGGNALEEKLARMGEKAEKLEHTWNRWVTGPHKAALRHIVKRLRILLRHYRPRSLSGYLHFGTGSADLTGFLSGVLFLLLPAAAQEYELAPEFTNACLDTDTTCAGHIRLIHLLLLAAALFLDRNFRILLRFIRHARKK